MIFEFVDYKQFLRHFLARLPNKGRGQGASLAKSLGVNSTMISQVLNAKPHFSPEQALALCRHFSFSEIETDYFVALVAMNRAGDVQTKNYFKRQLEKIRNKNENIKERLKLNSDLDDEAQARYYSQWYYSAIWLLSSIEKFQTKEAMSAALKLPLAKVSAALLFLQDCGLVQSDSGRWKISGTHIHVGQDSEHLLRHHQNWRSKAISHLEKNTSENDLHFTGPIVITEKEAKQIRKVLMKCLEDFRKISGPADCEEVYCLNLDWFKLVD